VLAYMRKTPVVRHRQSASSMAEPAAGYGTLFQTASLRQINTVLQNMTPAEQERLERFLAREGLRGFLTRLGIADAEA